MTQATSASSSTTTTSVRSSHSHAPQTPINKTSEQCGPEACTGGNDLNSISMYVHDDCNGGGCDAKPTPNLTPGESFCDLEFTYCGDRIMRLVSRGPDDCKAMSDLSEANNGQAYATLVEGDTDVGTCSVDFSVHKTCSVFAGGSNNDSQVYCAFF